VVGTVVVIFIIKEVEEGEAELTQKELLNFIKDILIFILWETPNTAPISGKQIRALLIDVPRTQEGQVLSMEDPEGLPQNAKAMFVIAGEMAVMDMSAMVLAVVEAEPREMLIMVV
jgi:hypothetical protein